ncbi:hypothetical protein OG21DRAFT_1488894 [Imleria badia]|nr:hypothetical protein OG21DRAFT_1488894 [Imleria badia]
MLVVEQQAKLGVSAEESKAERLKRQQARFRDRDVKRLSLSKARQASAATVAEESQAVAGSFKPTARKGKAKAVKIQARLQSLLQSAAARQKAKRKHQSLPANTKSKSTSKGKGKQRAAPSTKDGNPKTKPKPKPKPKPKELVEVLVSDDDTLVEVPRKVKSNSKRNIRHEDDGDTDDDAPLVRKQAKSHAAGAGTFGKKTLEDDEERTHDEKCPKADMKKRPVSLDDDDDIVGPPAKKGKATNPTSAKPKTVIEPKPAPRPAKDIKKGENFESMGKGKGNIRAGPAQEIIEPVEEDDDKRPLERVAKPKKRKKEDNYDDRPRTQGTSFSSSHDERRTLAIA